MAHIQFELLVLDMDDWSHWFLRLLSWVLLQVYEPIRYSETGLCIYAICEFTYQDGTLNKVQNKCTYAMYKFTNLLPPSRFHCHSGTEVPSQARLSSDRHKGTWGVYDIS
jgi:hypothetical protein